MAVLCEEHRVAVVMLHMKRNNIVNIIIILLLNVLLYPLFISKYIYVEPNDIFLLFALFNSVLYEQREWLDYLGVRKVNKVYKIFYFN